MANDEWAHVKLRKAVTERFKTAINAHPEEGFNSLADFLTRAGLEYASRLEQGPRIPSPVTSPPPAPVAKGRSPPASPESPYAEDEGRGRSSRSPPREVSPPPEAAPVPDVHPADGAARDGEDVELDLRRLAKVVRSRIQAGLAVESGRTPRDVQVAIVQLEAERQGVALTDVDAAEVLERILDPRALAQFPSPRSSKAKGAAAG